MNSSRGKLVQFGLIEYKWEGPLTSVESSLIVVIAATKEKVADHGIDGVARKKTCVRTNGVLNITKVLIYSWDNIAGRDKSCGEI